MLLFGHLGITAGTARLFIRKRIDYRFVIAGSLLPDIIDKPIFFLFSETAQLSGRAYAHTLLFSLALLAGGLLFARRGTMWLLLLSFGNLAHLLLDQMWRNQVTLLWPLLGGLKQGEPDTWLSSLWQGLLSPSVFVPELIGLGLCAYFFIRLLPTRSFSHFLKTGEIR